MTIGERIKSCRETANLTQDELAKRLATTKQTIYKYENNIVTNIPSDKIEKMAELFNVTPAFLMGWEDDNKSSWQPKLTDKDEKELDKKVEDLLSAVDSDTGLMLDGQVMDDETREIFAMNLKNALRTTKLAAKAKYTPKKYRE